MPERKLSDEERRRLTLAALSGIYSITELAYQYEVSRSHVYKLKDEATRDAEEEGAFWDEVRVLTKD